MGLISIGEELDRELEAAMAGGTGDQFEWGGGDLNVNSVVDGRILRVDDDFVLLDVGYKSEGQIPRNEWDDTEDPPEVGQVIKVLVEEVEGSQELLEEPRGMTRLRQAARPGRSKTG